MQGDKTEMVNELMLEFTGEGVYAPALIFIRDGIKYVHCRTDPPMMFDLNADPEERNNLALEPSYLSLANEMKSEIDKRWKEHLSAMDQMREGINLRAYGQKNPLIEYKKEGFLLFEDMMFYINKEILKNIFRTNLTKVDESKIIVESNIPKNIKLSHNKNLGLNLPNSKNQKKPSIPISNSNPINKKYGRNDKIKISNGSEIKIIKFKKAESLLNQGWSIIE